jgi:hypothetical protein
MEKVLLGSFCGAGVVRASFLQGATKSVLGALVLLRQTNRNACPIGMRWVRPTNLNACESIAAASFRLWLRQVAAGASQVRNGSHGFLRIARTALAFQKVECVAFYALLPNVTSLFRRDS